MTKEQRMSFTEMIQDFLGILREERDDWRRRRRLSPQERAFEDIARRHTIHRADVTDGFVFTEHTARALMEERHSESLRYVEFEDGLTVAVLKDGRRLEYDEAGRLIS